jgi:U3 small nucleolar RNA-associated protein 18
MTHKRFESINPIPQWAATARRKRRRHEMELDDSNSDALEGLLNSTTGIARSISRLALPKGMVDIERLRDANQASKTEGDVKTVQFHPSPVASVMLSAGGDRRLKLYTVDGHTNPLLQTVHIPSLPISAASFHPSGSHILLTGPRPFFFQYDLQSGVCTKSPRGLWGTFSSKIDNPDHSLEKNAFSPDGRVLAVAGRRGYVYLVEWTTGSPQVVSSLKMNTGVRSIWWNTRTSASNTRELYTLGDNSEVYVWDIRSRGCLKRWKDDGGYGATHIAGSGQGDYLAVGYVHSDLRIWELNSFSGRNLVSSTYMALKQHQLNSPPTQNH